MITFSFIRFYFSHNSHMHPTSITAAHTSQPSQTHGHNTLDVTRAGQPVFGMKVVISSETRRKEIVGRLRAALKLQQCSLKTALMTACKELPDGRLLMTYYTKETLIEVTTVELVRGEYAFATLDGSKSN